MRRRAAIGGLLLCGVLWMQQAPLWTWVVEDAAISFAYARNLADGVGLVPFPGAERVEGYSNPLWVAVLAGAHAIGLELFSASRWLGATLSAATLVGVLAFCRALMPDRPELPWLAGTALVLDPQHVIWGTSGLENPLFSALLAVGAWRVLVDGPGRPWAPLCFLGLALTRPEGAAYALVAGPVALSRAGRAGAAAVVRAWFVWALLPLTAVHTVRFAYFAMELPATYYAKLGTFRFQPLAWNARSWSYLRDWALVTGAVWWVPLFAVGLWGARGWRVGAVVAFSLLFAVVFGAGEAVPVEVRVGVLISTLVLAPALVPAEGRAGRVLVWGCAAVALVFCVRSGGDWMRGFRWLSLASVPLAVGTGLGLSEIVRALAARGAGPWLRWGMIALALPLYVAPRWVHLADLVAKPVASPPAIRSRLVHYRAVLQRRLWLDWPLRIVDHDMGGLLWWGNEGIRFHDAKGLVDLPFALHHQVRPFVSDYLFTSGAPDMAHAHGSTRRALRFLPEFRSGFVEIDGLGGHGGQTIHTGLFLREDAPGVLRRATWPDAGLRAVRVPSPEVSPGSGLFVEITLAAESGRPFRAVLILADEERMHASWDLPPAYDWVDPEAWGEAAFVGRFAVVVPEDTPVGRYHLRLAVIGADGAVAAPVSVEAPVRQPDEPVWAVGEVRLPERVEIVERDTMHELAMADHEDAVEHAEGRRCESAEEAWERALRHRTRAGDWRRAHRPAVATALARCWAVRGGRGDREGDALLERVAELERARGWDPRLADVTSEAQRVSAEAWGRGLHARTRGDHDAAFLWFDAAVRAEPSFAWARRYAEQARAARLSSKPLPGPTWPFDPPVGGG